MLELMKTLWRGWKRVVHGINTVISVVLMSVVYWLAVTPVALGFAIFKRDALDRGPGKLEDTTNWTPITAARQDVRRAQRPW